MVIDTVLAWKNHMHVTPKVKEVLERVRRGEENNLKKP